MKNTFLLLLLTLFLQIPSIGQKSREPLVIPENISVHKNLVYSTPGEVKLLLDLYLPTADAPTPLVIWVHGGAWLGGSKDYPKDAIQLLNKGMAVASINYRLSSVAKFPAQIVDCKSAVRWLRANSLKYNLNPDRFGAWGSSAGGHLVALMGTSNNVTDWELGNHLDQSSTIQAVCDYYGPTDFLRMDDAPGKFAHLDPESPESKLLGQDIRAIPNKVFKANPISYISKDDPPFLIMHGQMDKTVIPGQSILLHDALQSIGSKSELLLIEGAGHGGKVWRNYTDKVVSFFAKELSVHNKLQNTAREN